MLSKKLSKEIINASENMNYKDFSNYLVELEQSGVFETTRENWDYCIDYARHLVDKIKNDLDNGQWFGCEAKILLELDDISCDTDDIIQIDSYGYAQQIESNNDLLCVMGITEQLYQK